MAHQHSDAEADDVRELDMDNMDDAAQALADVMNNETLPEDDEPEAEADDDADEGEEDGQDEGEPDEPAIAPPASLTAEEKERFLALPQEAQEVIAEVEARRNKDVQEGLSKARTAQQQAEAIAAETQATAKQEALEQIHRFALAYAPQAPDPQLAYQDPYAYNQQKAIYDAEFGQHQQLLHQIQNEYAGVSSTIAKAEQEALQADAMACLDELPELRDATQVNALLERLTPIAKELGYDDKRIAQAMPSDIRAMKRAADWKAKAAKYDELQRTKMTAVRSAKTATPGVPQSRNAGKAKTHQQARERLRSNGDLNAAAAAIATLG